MSGVEEPGEDEIADVELDRRLALRDARWAGEVERRIGEAMAETLKSEELDAVLRN